MDIHTLTAIGGMALVLSFLVIIHELGHFLAAKWMKIRVEEFGLGYPPRAFTLFTKWGTIFSFNWIPFGGFVRMQGEDGEASDQKTTPVEVTDEGPFYSKTISQRLVVILAGATVNFVFGIIAFSIVFSLLGIPAGARIEEIGAGSPAEQAGLEVGTAIVAVEANGKEYEIRGANQLFGFTRSHYGQEVTITSQVPCDQTGCTPETRTDTVRLRSEDIALQEGALGVTPSDYTRFYPWYEMPIRGSVVGVEQALMLSWSILQALGGMLSNLVTQGAVPSDVAGPVGIVNDARKTGIFEQGPIIILLFTGVISVNLAIMNVLPIPALDGGRAVFLILEKLLGQKKISKVEGYANYGGYVLLLTMIVLITVRDVFRIFGG